MSMENRPEKHGAELAVENKEHYAYQVQMLINMYNAGKLPEVESITVEPKYGYMGSINYHNGEHRIIYGHDPGFNAGSSEQLANDKGYSKFMLREMGVKCANGDEFLLPWWAETLRQSERHAENYNIQTTDEVSDYIKDSLQYPVYIKPVSGSQGSGVRKVYDDTELEELFAEYSEERVRVALVEEALSMPDYRLLIFDGQLVNAYERQPLSVTGDGEQSIETLTRKLNDGYKEQNREIHLEEQIPHIVRHLGKTGLDLSTIPAIGEKLQLLAVSNLSAGGTPIDITDTIHPRWVELARDIASRFNLRVCGIDLACADISSGDSDYGVIEVNATPGAKQFMASGEAGREKLEDLFLQFFRTSGQQGTNTIDKIE